MATVRGYVYHSCGRDGIFIVDVRNAGEPRVVGSSRAFAPPDANGIVDPTSDALTLEEWRGSLLVGTSESRRASVGPIVSGGHLMAVDLADPERPRVAWDVSVGGAVHSIAEVADGVVVRFETSMGEHTNATTAHEGFVVADPGGAQMTDQMAVDGVLTAFAATGSHAYALVLNSESQDAVKTLEVIGPPDRPSLREGASHPYTSTNFAAAPKHMFSNFFPHSAEVRNDVLAVAESFEYPDRMQEGFNLPTRIGALRQYDVSDAGRPRPLSWIELPLTGSWIWGDLAVGSGAAYISGDISGEVGVVVDTRDPSTPNVVATFEVPSLPEAPRLVEANDGLVAVGSRLVDVSDPLRPISGPRGSVGIRSGALSFVADRLFGLRINQVAADGSVREVGALETAGRALRVEVVDDLAYIAHTGPDTKGYRFQMPDPTRWIMVADVSDPARPRVVVDLSMESLARAAGDETDGWTAVTAWAVSRDALATSIRTEPYQQDDFVVTVPVSMFPQMSPVAVTGFGHVGALAIDGCTLYVRQGEAIDYTLGSFGGPLFVTDICSAPGHSGRAAAAGDSADATRVGISQPRVISQLPLASGTSGRLNPDGDRLYVTDDLGLLEIDVSDRSAPKPVRMLAGAPINGVVRIGDYLFMGGGPLGLLVANANTDTTAP